MRRIGFTAFAMIMFGLAPVTGNAGPFAANSAAASNPSVIYVAGWWEQEHQEQRAREGYWHLRPPELERYNRLQSEINQLQRQRQEIDQRLSSAQEQQHELLGIPRGAHR